MNDEFPPTPKNCLSIAMLMVGCCIPFVTVLVICPITWVMLWQIDRLKPVLHPIGRFVFDGSPLLLLLSLIAIGMLTWFLVRQPFIKH
jgi:hypothetical protein